MEHRLRKAVDGWIRENYDQAFLDDISDIICDFYLIRMESKILTSSEQMELLDLIFNKLTKANGKDIKSIDAKLLYRGSEHQFDNSKFHELCDNKGATITVIHNDCDHIFGGYVTKCWTSDTDWRESYEPQIVDSTAFLWKIRPYKKVYGFKQDETEYNAIYCGKHNGPVFGKGSASDLWISANGQHNGCVSTTFEFEVMEFSGKSDHEMISNSKPYCRFDVKEYEVFSLSFE